MIYFHKIEILNIPRELIEKIIRASTSKRHISLDLLSSSTYIKGEKYFLGIESDKFIKIIRIKTPLEKILPRVIARFDKGDFGSYTIRLCLISFLITVFLSIALVLNITFSIINRHWERDLVSVIILSMINLALIMIEIKFTKRKISTILEKKNTINY